VAVAAEEVSKMASKQGGRDVREQIEDIREAFASALDELQSRMYTAFPVKIDEYDEKKQTAKVKALIKGTIRKEDGSIEKVELPDMQDVPVHFQSGGREEDQGSGGGGGSGPVSASAGGGGEKSKGYMLTFPLKKGDECLAIVSSRAIDRWHEKGDVQNQATARMHDLSDVIILPGMKSKPRAEEVKDGAHKENPEFRSVNGKHKSGIADKEDGGLYHSTTEHIKSNADKNIESEAKNDITTKAGENGSHEIGKVQITQAGKAIVKKAPKVIINST
jgi:hypothetical protein